MSSVPEVPAVVWHTFPLGVLGADQTGAARSSVRRLSDLRGWLPHVSALGADTLLLGPIFASVSHGYDTIDHRLIDERLGSESDLDALVKAAAACGIGVVLDGVFAYASRQFWRLGDVGEDERPWFCRDREGQLMPWRVNSLITPDYGASGYRNYVTEVMRGWLDRGISGWRLDSAWSVPDRFWRIVLAGVRQTHPQAWILGQTFDDDLPPVMNSTTYSSTTEYALMHGIREWVAGGPSANMVTALRTHQHNSTRNPVHTFLGNHDFARLADVIGAELVPLAFALLLTVPGVPAVYYGDEFGVTSDWTESGDDTVLRPPLQPRDDAASTPRARGLVADIQALGMFRRANRWLTHASLRDVRVDGHVLSYQVAHDTEAITVHLNRAATPISHGLVRIPPRGWIVRESGSGAESSPEGVLSTR